MENLTPPRKTRVLGQVVNPLLSVARAQVGPASSSGKRQDVGTSFGGADGSSSVLLVAYVAATVQLSSKGKGILEDDEVNWLWLRCLSRCHW
jgi:hypothetical protein